VVKYWLNSGFLSNDQLVPIAQAAERLGYEGIAMPDHLIFPDHIESLYPYSPNGEIAWPTDAPWPDCWSAISVMASATQSLRFTTSVYIAPLRNVFTLAKSVATAVGFGPGRVTCGLGAGWMQEEYDIVGESFASRGKRFDEMLDVLPMLWTGDSVEYHGEQIDFAPTTMRPPVGHVPILIGGNTKTAMRRAARNDGWIGTYTDIDGARRMLAQLADVRTEPDEFFETMFVASPRAGGDADALDDLGVDGIIIPTVSLGASWSTDDLVAGLERFAERRMT
jgi:probable F420-dependent oxidoreductase